MEGLLISIKVDKLEKRIEELEKKINEILKEIKNEDNNK